MLAKSNSRVGKTRSFPSLVSQKRGLHIPPALRSANVLSTLTRHDRANAMAMSAQQSGRQSGNRPRSAFNSNLQQVGVRMASNHLLQIPEELSLYMPARERDQARFRQFMKEMGFDSFFDWLRTTMDVKDPGIPCDLAQQSIVENVKRGFSATATSMTSCVDLHNSHVKPRLINLFISGALSHQLKCDVSPLSSTIKAQRSDVGQLKQVQVLGRETALPLSWGIYALS